MSASISPLVATRNEPAPHEGVRGPQPPPAELSSMRGILVGLTVVAPFWALVGLHLLGS